MPTSLTCRIDIILLIYYRYTRPFQFPGKVTLTAPYLDMGGAGYITTISHTIFEGK